MTDHENAIQLIQEQIDDLRGNLHRKIDNAVGWLDEDSDIPHLSEALDLLSPALYGDIEKLRALGTARLELEIAAKKRNK